MSRAMTALLLALLVAIGGGELANPGRHKALAADALPRVQHQQVCAGNAAAEEALHHAAVVIVFPTGTDTYCVPFDEEELSGAELLQRTGLPLVLSGFGGLGSGLCRIDDVGCSDPGDCFCQCRGADCSYWTYYQLDGAEWRIQNIGASQRDVHDGDVDGWVWGDGRTPPGKDATEALCSSLRSSPPPAATPLQPTPLPSATPNAPHIGAVQPATVASVAPAQPASTPTSEPGVTPEPAVVRQSSRPLSQAPSTERDASPGGSEGGLPTGLLAFGAVAAGLIVVAGGVAQRRRPRG